MKQVLISFTILLVISCCYADYKQQLLDQAVSSDASGKEALKFLNSHHMTEDAAALQANLTELETHVPLLKAAHDDSTLFREQVKVLGAERRLVARTRHALIARSDVLYERADEAIHILEQQGKKDQANIIKQDKAALEKITTQLKGNNTIEKNLEFNKETLVVQNRLEHEIDRVLGSH